MQTNNNNKQTIASYQSNALGERIMDSYPVQQTEDTEGKAEPSLRVEALSDKRGKPPPSQTRYYLYDKQQW